MKQLLFSIKTAAFLLFILTSCKPAEITQQEQPAPVLKADVHQQVTRLIVNTPANTTEEEVWINEELTKLGADAVRALSQMLIDPSAGSDLKPRYALSSLANYAARPGAKSERETFEKAILSELKDSHSNDVKTFLMKQLRRTAGNRSVAVLESYLDHDKLYNEALRVLLIIDSPEAASAVRNTFSTSSGPQRIALVKALGELRDHQSTDNILPLTDSENYPLKRMALFAVSEIGRPGASSKFEQAISENTGFEASEIISFYHRYAERLSEEGYRTESDRITDYFITGNFPSHVKSSALTTRFHSNGISMVDELIEITQNSDEILARTAIRLLNTLEGNDITEHLIETLYKSTEMNKSHVINALAERGDKEAVSALKEYADQPGQESSADVLSAIFLIEGEMDPSLVIALLQNVDSAYEILRAEQLLKQIEPNVVIPAVAAAISEIPAHGKPVLIRVLADYQAGEYKSGVINEWNESSGSVREAILQYLTRTGEPQDIATILNWYGMEMSDENRERAAEIVAIIMNRSYTASEKNQRFQQIYSQASDQQKQLLTRAAPQISGIDHDAILNASLISQNSGLRSAAMNVLSSWDRPQILPLLAQVIPSASEDNIPELMANYLRIINRIDESTAEKSVRIEMLYNRLAEPGVKATFIQQLSLLDDRLALRVLSTRLSDENDEIREISAGMVADILEPFASDNTETLDVSEAYLAGLEHNTAETIETILNREKIREDNNETGSGTPPYGMLFNGENLDGWQPIGNENAWGVEDGLLYTDGAGSGWLSTNHQYDNFVIELEYRVPEGGNSGLFIRAPHGGNPASEGLEIQILDDYADRYADLQPWQFTGSIYFEQAVSERVTKPAGEWQSMKVRADGPVIQVTINGKLVNNANLIHYMDNASNHPGLLKRSGYVGLQNHGDRVEFRNIRIHEIQ